jgi:hypothetical protein
MIGIIQIQPVRLKQSRYLRLIPFSISFLTGSRVATRTSSS